MTAAENPSADLPRYVVVGGGTPTPEQLAALAIALTPVVVEADDGAASRPPAWTRAALAENVGGRLLVSADDLAATPRPV